MEDSTIPEEENALDEGLAMAFGTHPFSPWIDACERGIPPEWAVVCFRLDGLLLIVGQTVNVAILLYYIT